MKFFGNSAINRANIHTAIQSLAQGGGGVFVFVFLLTSGVPTPLVLLTIAAMTGGRFVLRAGVLPIVRRIGLRNAVILGTLMEAATFPLLPLVHGPGAMLVLVIVVSAAGSVLYWTSYHAYFAALGDAEERGGQVGARETMAALLGVVAPALGALALTTAGPSVAFWGVAVVQALAAAPLIGAPDLRVAEDAPGGFRAATFAATVLAFDGWFAASFFYVWQIALFVSLGNRFAAFGGAMAIAGIASAVGSLLIGRLIDRGYGRGSVLFAYSAAAFVVLIKAAGFAHVWTGVIANALGALAIAFVVPALMSRVYNLAKTSPCPLRFHIATEAGWDLGCTAGCLTAAALTWREQPFSSPILLALVGAAGSCAMLLSSYANRAPR